MSAQAGRRILALAANGGSPVRTRPFPPWPQVDDRVRAALSEVVESGHWWQAEWSTGRVELLEQHFAARFDTAGCVAVMNGTAALELAFGALQLGPGDEVLVPATTFISTATAVSSVGAMPVPADVDHDALHLDVGLLEAGLSNRTRAVAPVHLSGDLVDMRALRTFAERHGLAVVEDAAQALGARRDGQGVGSLGALTTLSFQAGKLLPAGEGGAVLVRDDSTLLERLHRMSHCGVPRGAPWYAHEVIGSNRRMTEFQAAAALAQVPAAADRAAQRSAAATVLTAELTRAGLGTPMCTPPGTESLDPSMFWFWLPEDVQGRTDATEMARLLTAEGIPAAPMYPAWQTTPAYRGEPAIAGHRTPVAVHATNNVVWLHHRLLLDGPTGVGDILTALSKVLTAVRHRSE